MEVSYRVEFLGVRDVCRVGCRSLQEDELSYHPALYYNMIILPLTFMKKLISSFAASTTYYKKGGSSTLKADEASRPSNFYFSFYPKTPNPTCHRPL